MTEAEERERLRYLHLKAKAARATAPVAAQPMAPPGPSGGESFARGGIQGLTINNADEGAGLWNAAKNFSPSNWLGDKLHPFQPVNRGPLDYYREGRDEYRQKDDAAIAAHPAFYIGGNIGGALLAAPLIPGSGAGTLGQLARTGAIIGGLNSFGASRADLTKGEWDRAARDTVGVTGLQEAGKAARDGEYLRALLNVAGSGAIGGAIGGVVVPQALRAAGATARAVAPRVAGAAQSVAPALERIGIAQGRRVLLNGADSLSSRVPTSDAAVAEAIRSGGIRPFGSTGQTFERLEGLAADQGDVYGNLLTQLEAHGVQGPEAQAIADELLSRANTLESQTMNPALPTVFRDQAGLVTTKVPPGMRLGLRQGENLKRSVQDMARYGRLEETPVNEIRREAASVFRQGTEDAVDAAGQAHGAGSQVRTLADMFVPVKQRLGLLIEAREAAERGATRAAQRRGLSLTDNMMAASQLATGDLRGAALAAGANNLLRNRVPSATAAYSLRLADMLRGYSPTTQAAGAVSPISARLLLGSLRSLSPSFAPQDPWAVAQ